MNLILSVVLLEQKGDIVKYILQMKVKAAIRVEFWGDEIEKLVEINPPFNWKSYS